MMTMQTLLRIVFPVGAASRPRFLIALFLCALGVTSANAATTFSVLCYHEVIDEPNTPRSGEFPAVTVTELVTQFAWLREHGYRVISLDDVLAAQQGKIELPPRSVLLTFDDGYASVYDHVYPLLKAFNYHAVIGVVGAWMVPPAGAEVPYGSGTAPRSRFLTWAQLKEMADSKFIEIASHSYDMHHGIPGNPQGNLQPAAATRYFNSALQDYESEAKYLARIEADLRKNNDVIFAHTGHRPRTMVWPFGAYNAEALRIARDAGMAITLTLDEGRGQIDDVTMVRRSLVPDGAGIQDVIWNLEPSDAHRPVRVVHADLDYIYSDDAAQQEKNLSALLDRVKRLNINTVYLQAFSDVDGDGAAEAVYFPNRHMPVRANLFNRVAWQLRTRTNVHVYAWMPVMAFRLPETHPAAALRVVSLHPDDARSDYFRLSPFALQARHVIEEIYEDLARYASFQGLLFHDDAYLTDYEDVSPPALNWYEHQWGLPSDVASIRADKEKFAMWSTKKTAHLADFTQTLLNRAQHWRPRLLSARNLYANVVLDPESETWYAQSLPVFLQRYDYTALMAMPYMEQATSPSDWYSALVGRIKAIPNAMDRTVFELQSVDWRGPTRVESDVLAAQLQELQRLGARHLGYYPDDFVKDHPDVAILYPAFSLSQYPYRE